VPGKDVTNNSLFMEIALVVEAAGGCYSHEGEEDKIEI